MAEQPKILGQAFPAAANFVRLYLVPNDTYAVCSCVAMCNTAAGDDQVIVQCRKGDLAEADRHNLFRGLKIRSGDTHAAVLGITLSAGDAVWVWATNGQVAFNLFGTEVF